MADQNILVLSDLTVDFEQFKSQMKASLAGKSAWSANLTTETSTTLIDLAATIGTFTQGRLLRSVEDLYSETALSDDAIRAITGMQGIRMSRRLPATIEVSITCPYTVTLDPLTVFVVSGSEFFCRESVTLTANTPRTVTLYQGSIQTYALQGLGTARQFFVSEELNFQVSDQDVMVLVNNTVIPKTFGGLWNNKDTPGYMDSTLPDGRLLIVFGNGRYGTVPGSNDQVVVRYAVTRGASGSARVIMGGTVSVSGFPDITGVATSNPTGGANEQSTLTYKNLGAGSFGTYGSAVTKNQYVSTVGVYPGIIDAVTQAQREINPSAVRWMNVIRVSGLTSSPWGQQQKRDFCDYMQKVTMYSPYFVWVDAIEVPRDVELEVYCFNTAVLSDVEAEVEAAIIDLFAAKPGILMTNFYESDLDTCAKKATNGAISYVKVKAPVQDMVVTAPESPLMTYTVVPGGGTLSSYVYQYGMSTVNTNGEEGPPANWVAVQVDDDAALTAIRLDWPPIGGASKYRLYGRKSGEIGLIAEIDAADPLTFLDDGSIVPSGDAPNMLPEVPIRYNSLRTLKVTAFFAERQQRISNTPYRGI